MRVDRINRGAYPYYQSGIDQFNNYFSCNQFDILQEFNPTSNIVSIFDRSHIAFCFSHIHGCIPYGLKPQYHLLSTCSYGNVIMCIGGNNLVFLDSIQKVASYVSGGTLDSIDFGTALNVVVNGYYIQDYGLIDCYDDISLVDNLRTRILRDSKEGDFIDYVVPEKYYDNFDSPEALQMFSSYEDKNEELNDLTIDKTENGPKYLNSGNIGDGLNHRLLACMFSKKKSSLSDTDRSHTLWLNNYWIIQKLPTINSYDIIFQFENGMFEGPVLRFTVEEFFYLHRCMVKMNEEDELDDYCLENHD